MNVALPLSDSRFAPVADAATLWRVVTPEGEVVENLDLSVAYPQSYPEFLVKRDVGVVLCSGISPLLARLFLMKGIEVVHGVSGSPTEAFNLWRSGAVVSNRWNNGRGRGRRRGRRCRHGHTFRR